MRALLAKLTLPFRGPDDPDPTVRAYINQQLEGLSRRLIRDCSVFAFFYHLIELYVDRFYLPASMMAFVMVLRWSSCASFALTWYLNWRHSSPKYLFLAFQVLAACIYAKLVWDATDYTSDSYTYLIALFVLATTFFTYTCPLRGWKPVLMAVFYQGLFYVAVQGSPKATLWNSIQFQAFAFALYFHFVNKTYVIKRADREIRDRLKIAPSQIVYKSVMENRPLGELFEPSERGCVCLSSDWRNYQQLTEQISNEHLEKRLRHYYEEVQNILRRRFPGGNYFSDWIADELFVVIYFDATPEQTKSYTNQALQFAYDVLSAKSEIFADVPEDIGIDVGLAVGTARVGMMGPPSHLKATALGQLPGRSRRLQTLGKVFRQNFGHEDRILFGREVFMRVATPFSIRHVEVADPSSLRDLDDATLYSIEPANDDELSQAMDQVFALELPGREAKKRHEESA